MRILLDHNVPRQLRRFLPGHYIQTSREAGWDDLSDGELLLEAERAAYEVFITGDQSLTSQQNLTGLAFAIVVLEETSWPTLRLTASRLALIIQTIHPGDIVRLPRSG